MIDEGLPDGKYRLEIYECVKSVIKRDLTDAEHKYLSHILKCYANTAKQTKLEELLRDLPKEKIIHSYMKTQEDALPTERCHGWNDFRNEVIKLITFKKSSLKVQDEKKGS